MLIGLQSDLVAGESFELELNFEKAGRIVLQVEVRQP
jgi:copper(I)-binding protein